MFLCPFPCCPVVTSAVPHIWPHQTSLHQLPVVHKAECVHRMGVQVLAAVQEHPLLCPHLSVMLKCHFASSFSFSREFFWVVRMPGGPTSALPADWCAVKRGGESFSRTGRDGGDLQRLPHPSTMSHISTFFNNFHEKYHHLAWIYITESWNGSGGTLKLMGRDPFH